MNYYNKQEDRTIECKRTEDDDQVINRKDHSKTTIKQDKRPVQKQLLIGHPYGHTVTRLEEGANNKFGLVFRTNSNKGRSCII